jgi:ferredoxin
MSTEIYYFSGTGNSLAVAREIAKNTNGTLIFIPSVVDKQNIKIEAGNIGIVFPCYLAQLYGIPLVVEKFIKKLENIGSKYIFAVCTCGGHEMVNALPALKNLAKLIQSMGGDLTGEFSIHLPMNNLKYPSVFIDQNQENMFQKSRQKIEVISQCVINREKSPYKILKSLFNGLMTPMYLMMQNLYISHLKKMSREPNDTNLKYFEMIPLTDKSIFADEKCNGCATCAKICPVQNIKLTENKPVWQHHCEMCMACAEWCPIKAIHHWNISEGKSYHHPDVKLSDLLMENKNRNVN